MKYSAMKSGTKISIFQRDNCIYPSNYSVSSQKTATVTISAMKTSESYKKYMLLTTQNRRHILQQSTPHDTGRCNLFQYAHSSRKHWFCLSVCSATQIETILILQSHIFPSSTHRLGFTNI